MKIFKIILIVVVVLIVGIIAWFVKDSFAIGDWTPKDPRTTSIPSVQLDHSDWETYRSENWGFEISFPKSLFRKTEKVSSISISTKVEEIDNCPHGVDCPFTLHEGEMMMDISRERCDDWFFDREEKMVSGNTIYTGDVDQGGDNPGYRTALCLKKKNESVSITVTTTEAERKLAEDILSTFKVI